MFGKCSDAMNEETMRTMGMEVGMEMLQPYVSLSYQGLRSTS